jgi:hypothetical protein
MTSSAASAKEARQPILRGRLRQRQIKRLPGKENPALKLTLDGVGRIGPAHQLLKKNL